MTLDRDELAARFAVADLSNPNFATDFTDAKEVERWAAGLKGLADALLAALVPVAPASGAPATDPRRTVGAVVKTPGFETEWVVLGAFAVRRLDSEKGGESQIACKSDEFVRWATREECERHGIPYVERCAAPSPAATPAALTEAEQDDLTNTIGAEMDAADADDNDERMPAAVAADAAAAWFARRGGAK